MEEQITRLDTLENPEGFVLTNEERNDIIDEVLTYLDETDSTLKRTDDTVTVIEGDIDTINTDGVEKAKELVDDNLVTQIDGAARNILKDFKFGSTDYAGAVKAGNVVWNQSTGEPTSGSGIIIHKGGIVGVKNAVKKFAIEDDGNAYFGGELQAASGTFAGDLQAVDGTFGTITSGTITGCTLTGDTLQTASSGRRIRITTDQYIRWYDGGSIEGLIYTDSSGNMQIKGFDKVIITTGSQSTDYLQLQANSGDIFIDSSSLYFDQDGDWQINKSDNIYINFYDDGFNIYEDDGLAFRINSGKDTWIADNCSADSFTDRTPYYEGDALEELSKIKGKKNKDGELEIDHKTLPAFTSKTKRSPNEKGKKKTAQSNGRVEKIEEVEEVGRDLGATISMLVVAVNQLNERTK